MFPTPHRSKGGGPLLGATADGQRGPFGVRGEDDGHDDDGPDLEAAVDDIVQARIAAARVRIQAAKARRESFAAARKAGLAHRHAAKLRNLADDQT